LHLPGLFIIEAAVFVPLSTDTCAGTKLSALLGLAYSFRSLLAALGIGMADITKRTSDLHRWLSLSGLVFHLQLMQLLPVLLLHRLILAYLLYAS